MTYWSTLLKSRSVWGNFPIWGGNPVHVFSPGWIMSVKQSHSLPTKSPEKLLWRYVRVRQTHTSDVFWSSACTFCTFMWWSFQKEKQFTNLILNTNQKQQLKSKITITQMLLAILYSKTYSKFLTNKFFKGKGENALSSKILNEQRQVF